MPTNQIIHGIPISFFFSEKLNTNLSICKKFSKNKFKLYLKKYLQKSFLETWLDIRNSYLLDTGKLSTYFKFKFTFNYESYLNMNNFNNRRILTKFRLSNYSLRRETGRHELELLPKKALSTLFTFLNRK